MVAGSIPGHGQVLYGPNLYELLTGWKISFFFNSSDTPSSVSKKKIIIIKKTSQAFFKLYFKLNFAYFGETKTTFNEL